MKTITKLLCFAAFVYSLSVYAQKNIEVGVYAGIPTGDAAKTTSFNLGLNLAYTKEINEMLRIGVASGISHFFEKKNSSKNINFIPLAARGKYFLPGKDFSLSLDLGYAFYPDQEFRGGFYTFPKVGYNTKSSEIYLGYQFVGGKYTLTAYDPFTSQTLTSRLPFSVGSFAIGYNFSF